MSRLLLLSCLLGSFLPVKSQVHQVYGKITNAKLEPLALASIEVKELRQGITTKEDGSYLLQLEEGKYDLVVSMIGYQHK